MSYGLREKKKDKNVVKKHRKMAIFSVCFSYTFLVLGIWVLMSFLVCVWNQCVINCLIVSFLWLFFGVDNWIHSHFNNVWHSNEWHFMFIEIEPLFMNNCKQKKNNKNYGNGKAIPFFLCFIQFKMIEENCHFRNDYNCHHYQQHG